MWSLKERKWWMPLCIAVLAAAAVTVSLVLLYAPREETPPEETGAVSVAVVAVSPRPAPTPAPTPAPEPSPTATPVITPPAQNAASGSDVVLTHVPLSSGSDLYAGLATGPETGE